MAAVQSLTCDIPQLTTSITTSAASASGTAPAGAEYVRVSTTATCQFRYGIGAQTAVATDQILNPGESLVLRIPPGSAAAPTTVTFAAIGAAGLFSITRVFP